MGVFKQHVFGTSNRFDGPFFDTLTISVPSTEGEPGTASYGLSSVLIGDFPILEPFVPMGGSVR
jgi:hypothetical protein